MASITAQVVFQGKSNLPKDQFVNTFHFYKPGLLPSSAEMSAMSQALTDFYLHPDATVGSAVRDFLSSVIVDNPDPTIKYYDDLAPGSPIGLGSILGFGPFSGTVPDSLPNEVALCLSVHGDMTGLLESGASAAIPTDARAQQEGAPSTHTGKTRPKSRHRGRLYVGPLNVLALAHTANDDARPAANLITALRNQGNRLMTNGGGFSLNGWAWSTFSRRDNAAYLVTGGWVDNAFDTQRRRGQLATTRTTF